MNTAKNTPPLFCCKGVTKLYGEEPVIKNINLSLISGEFVCLLGPSGVGKSTLMGILSGVDLPDNGTVKLDGKEITGCPGKISYMLQKDLLLPYKTILDNTALPLLLKGTSRKESRAKAQSYFEVFGLSGSEEKYPHQLSGGMRQRAALLRTYLFDSRVMLLDEPFSALDAHTRQKMQDWYAQIVFKMGTATLFITHDIDEALILSDRICILSGNPGHIIREFHIDAPRPRDSAFSLTEKFLEQKKQILAAINS